jgi:predicted DNA-binding protein
VAKRDEVKVTIDLSRDMADSIAELSAFTRVPKIAYYREAIEDLLKKYDVQLREAKKKNMKAK